jgi:hypothetical protein
MTQEQKDKIVALNAKSKVETPVEAQTEVPQATDAPNPQGEEVVPKETPQTDEPKAVEVEKPEPVEASKSWDDDDTPEVKPEPSKIDYSKLGSALELGEVKDESDFITKASKLKSDLKELQEKPFSGIPEEFKEVIEVAKTGDWKDYLATQIIDYTKLDPIEEFEQEFIAKATQNQRYFTDGKFDQQKVDDALDAIADPIKEMQGSQILQDKAYQQARQREQLKTKALEKRESAEKSLTQATRDLNDLLPFKDHGIKFEPKHSTEIHQGISNSSLTKEYLGVNFEDLVRSGADMKVVAKTIATAKYAQKMLKFKSNASKVEAKKEILAATQNAQIKTPGSTINPSDPEKEIKSSATLMKEFLASQRRGL